MNYSACPFYCYRKSAFRTDYRAHATGIVAHDRATNRFFSGVQFDVNEEQGLVGFCDYILTRTSRQLFVEAPVVMLVEAKNEDMKRSYGQCLAEMLAAQQFNELAGKPLVKIYGAVTIGNLWKFLELEGTTARIDAADYYLDYIAKIFGILLHMIAPTQSPTEQ